MTATIKLIAIVAVILAVFAAFSFVAGRFLGQDTGIMGDLQTQNDQLRKELAAAQSEITKQKQVNAGLQADMAGGRNVEEQRQALETRSQELDRREQDLVVAEKDYSERESALRQREAAYHDATNVDQQEIGQAKQIQEQYDAMRVERDNALALAERWLMFIWGISIAAFLLILIFVLLAMRYWAKTVQYRSEAQQRQQAVQLLAATLGNSATPEQRQIILSTTGEYGDPSRSTK